MTTLRVIEPPESIFDTEVGDMWRTPERDTFGRESWTVHLPGEGLTLWNTTDTVDGEATGLWGVTGEPPNITVTPSINAHDRWHGFITNGEMTP